MMFTLEAIYLLHLYNDYSDDLVFLPLPNPDQLDRKTLLKTVAEKGFQDLKDLGLIVDDQATDDCVRYGQYLREYHENTYHYSVDYRYFVAPEVDAYKRTAVVLHQLEDNTFYFDRVTSIVLWGYLLAGHKVLHQLDDRFKDYLNYDWQPYSLLKTMIQHGEADALRLTVSDCGQVVTDSLFMLIEQSLYEYDVARQQRRSIDSDDLKEFLVQQAKVRL